MKSNSQTGNFPGGSSARDDKHWVNAVQRVRVALWSSYRDTSASPHLSMNRHAVWQCGALSTNQQQIVDRRQRGRKIHLQHIKNADHDDILTACMMLSATLWIYAKMGVCYSLPDLEVASACVRMVATIQKSSGDASQSSEESQFSPPRLLGLARKRRVRRTPPKVTEDAERDRQKQANNVLAELALWIRQHYERDSRQSPRV